MTLNKNVTSDFVSYNIEGRIEHSYGGEITLLNINKIIDKLEEEGITDPITQLGILSVIGKETQFVNKKKKVMKIRPMKESDKSFQEQEIWMI